jgi:hypothetical protein
MTENASNVDGRVEFLNPEGLPRNPEMDAVAVVPD